MANTEELGLEVFVEGWQRFERIMDKLDKSIDGTAKSMEKTGSVAGGAFAVALGTIAVNAAMALGRALLEVGKDIVGVGVAAVETAISYESAFAGVTKTTDGLIDEFGDLTIVGEEVRDGLRDISTETPITFEQLSGIAELGGQLGIERENLLDFTQVIADMGETTNLTGDMAATGLAQIANVMGTNQTEFSNMGSTVVALGNNLATTESDILSFAQRIAGAGSIVGLTEADIFAIGASFSSVGVKAEAGGTAVQKTLLGINEAVITGGSELETYAQTAGLSADEFIASWEQDAGGAFNQFVVGLGEAGDGAISILQDLGLEDQRLISGFLSLAAAGPLLGDAMDMANDAFVENNALSAEAAQRYATTESQIEICKNKIRDTGATLGDMLLPTLTDLISFLSEIVTSHGPQIQAVFETIAGAIATAAEIVMGFVDGSLGIADFIPIGSEVQGVFDAMGAWWAEHGPAIQESGEKLFGTLAEQGTKLKDNVLPFINELLLKFSDWWTENGPLIVSYIEQQNERVGFLVTAFTNFWSVVEPILTGLLDAILNVATFILAVATGDLPAALDAWIDIWLGLWDSLKEMFIGFADFVLSFLGTTWGEVVASWEASWEMFKEIVAVAWEIIKTKATEIWESIVTFINEKLQALLEFLGINTDEMKEKWSTILADIALIAEEVWARIVEFITEQAENIKTAVTEKINELKEFWGPIWEDIHAVLSAVWDKIVTAVTEKAQEVFAAISTKIDEIKSWLQGQVSEFTSIGSSLIDGLKAGITAKVQEVVQAVTALVSDAVAAAKAALQIDSPSKLFFSIGDSIGQGLIDGIDSKADGVADAISGLFDVGGGLGSIGGAVASRLKKEQLDPLTARISGMRKKLKDMQDERKKAEAAEIAEYGAIRDPGKQRRALWHEARLKDEIARADAKQVKLNKQLLALEKQRADLAFLKQQADLLDLIKEHGLDAADILGGLELGIDASLEGIVQAMSSAMAAIVSQVESELEISSPSKVFARIGERMMEGLSQGVGQIAPLVQAQINSVVKAPAQAMFGGAGDNVTNAPVTNFNLTTNSTTRPSGLAMEFQTMSFAGR